MRNAYYHSFMEDIRHLDVQTRHSECIIPSIRCDGGLKDDLYRVRTKINKKKCISRLIVVYLTASFINHQTRSAKHFWPFGHFHFRDKCYWVSVTWCMCNNPKVVEKLTGTDDEQWWHDTLTHIITSLLTTPSIFSTMALFIDFFKMLFYEKNSFR